MNKVRLDIMELDSPQSDLLKSLDKTKILKVMNMDLIIFNNVDSDFNPMQQLELVEELVRIFGDKNKDYQLIFTTNSGYFLEAMELQLRLAKLNNEVDFRNKDGKSCNDDLGELYINYLRPYEVFDIWREDINKMYD